MKILIIYVASILLFYFVDKSLNIQFVESDKLYRQCETRQDKQNQSILFCGYIWESQETMVTFYFRTPTHLKFRPDIMIYYQQFPAEEQLSINELFSVDTNTSFPIINENQAGIEELSKHHLKALDYEFRSGDTDGNENYLMTPELITVSAYVLFIKGLDVELEAYFKNNLKYLEDSFVTFLCFVILAVAINMIKEGEEENLLPLGKYINENQQHMLLIIILIAQPLRPLCYFSEFEAVEWLIGQTCYAIGEFLFLRYFLQILSFLKGQNNNTNKVRNTVITIFVIIPISIDRWIIAFDNQSFVIKDLENQVNNIHTIMMICWICFLVYSCIFAYEVMISFRQQLIRVDLFLIDIIFFIVYSFQKSQFYLYYERFDHHLFNPINMLMMVSYIAILLVIDLTMVSEKENELQTVNQDEEQVDNLDFTIAQYYKERQDDRQTLI
ncbi:unnamed protein product [Paramecium sonneborni]|uniref:Intimal thickness related receptor IRP domain-containing protein n=1 Tax=Paramecium sonneborni TaxID=65129 RepID=A0A8S1LNN5_9CILI|nr:unnamed protein product [Paramecium sonneborni]